jgi:penicillin-binding protein-related factor A (putative recombinase)
MTVNVQGLSRVCHKADLAYFSSSSKTYFQGMFIGKAIYFGRKAARDNYAMQIGNIVSAARIKLGEVPIVIGETGVPMDIK